MKTNDQMAPRWMVGLVAASFALPAVAVADPVSFSVSSGKSHLKYSQRYNVNRITDSGNKPKRSLVQRRQSLQSAKVSSSKFRSSAASVSNIQNRGRNFGARFSRRARS
ncbi:MAG: hypothetical protein AAGJ79_15130 [Verrucomicrobiota bacterium]